MCADLNLKLIQNCSSPTSGYIGSVSTPLFWVTYSTISCSAARFTSFHFKSERGSDTKSKRTQHWRIFWINSSSRSPWLASFNWGSFTSSLFWLMLNLESQIWIGFSCTLHIAFPHRYWHFYGTCWSFDVFPSWYGWGQHTFKLYFWDPFHIEVNAERKIMIINHLTSIYRYHDIMTIDHFDKKY